MENTEQDALDMVSAKQIYETTAITNDFLNEVQQPGFSRFDLTFPQRYICRYNGKIRHYWKREELNNWLTANHSWSLNMIPIPPQPQKIFNKTLTADMLEKDLSYLPKEDTEFKELEKLMAVQMVTPIPPTYNYRNNSQLGFFDAGSCGIKPYIFHVSRSEKASRLEALVEESVKHFVAQVPDCGISITSSNLVLRVEEKLYLNHNYSFQQAKNPNFSSERYAFIYFLIKKLYLLGVDARIQPELLYTFYEYESFNTQLTIRGTLKPVIFAGEIKSTLEDSLLKEKIALLESIPVDALRSICAQLMQENFQLKKELSSREHHDRQSAIPNSWNVPLFARQVDPVFKL